MILFIQNLLASEEPRYTGVNLVEMRRAAAYQINLGRRGTISEGLTSDELALLNDIANDALNMVLIPPVLKHLGYTTPFEWPFLRPTATLTTEADTDDYTMPVGFGAMLEPMTFAENEGYHEVALTNEGMIRKRRQFSSATGRPRMVAVVPSDHTGASVQTWVAKFWPTPDSDYVLTYRYVVQRFRLSDSYPFPPGGHNHGPLYLAAVKAAAEIKTTDMRGVHWERFIEALESAVGYEAANVSAKQFGRMGSGSRRCVPYGRLGDPCYRGTDRVTYNGEVGGA